MIFSRNRVLYSFLITAFYISLFSPMIEGIGRKVGEPYLTYIKALTQSYTFLLPFIIILFTNLQTKRFYLICILFIYTILIQIFTEYASCISVFQGYKSFFAVLLYIPIVYHLVCYDDLFEARIEKHIKIIFIVSAVILYFEIFSRYIQNDFYLFFISLPADEVFRLAYSRPLGIGLDIHMQGIILSSAIVYYFIHKNYKLSLVFFLALFLSGVKTWLIGVLLIGIIYFFIFFKRLGIFFITQFMFILFCTITFIVFVFYPQVEHYLEQLSPSSHVTPYMINLWVNSVDFFVISIFPQGFLTDEVRLQDFSLEVLFYNDIHILFLGYMIGSVGLILYIIIVYYNLLKKSLYTPIVILSLFSLVHVYYLNNIGIFIIITYFSMYFIIEKNKI